jgi:hypothetical protein
MGLVIDPESGGWLALSGPRQDPYPPLLLDAPATTTASVPGAPAVAGPWGVYQD